MTNDHEAFLDALEQQLVHSKVYCGDCTWYDPYAPKPIDCDHPHARTSTNTYKGQTVVWTPASVRNARNDCGDFTPCGSPWARAWRNVKKHRESHVFLACMLLLIGLFVWLIFSVR